MNNKNKIKNFIKQYNFKEINLFTIYENFAAKIEELDEETINDFIDEFYESPYSFLVFDEKELILNNEVEIPEEAKELILEMIFEKPRSTKENRLRKVFDLVEDDDWMAVLIEHMIRQPILKHQYGPKTIPEEMLEEIMVAYNYIRPDTIPEFDIFGETLFIIIYDYILNQKEQKLIEKSKPKIDEELFKRIKNSIMEQENATQLIMNSSTFIGKASFDVIFEECETLEEKEEAVAFGVRKFLEASIGASLILAFVSGREVKAKILDRSSEGFFSAHDHEDYKYGLDKNIKLIPWEGFIKD